MSMLSRAFRNPVGTIFGMATNPAGTIANLAAKRPSSGGLTGSSSTGMGINIGGPSGITIGGSGALNFGFPGLGGGSKTAVAGQQPPKGYHLSKDGKKWVRNRRTNFANGRANARAIRRLKGAEKQLRRIFQVMHHKSPAIKPKAGRKR